MRPIREVILVIVLLLRTSGVRQALDSHHPEVLVFEAQWVLQYTLEKNPHFDFRESM